MIYLIRNWKEGLCWNTNRFFNIHVPLEKWLFGQAARFFFNITVLNLQQGVLVFQIFFLFYTFTTLWNSTSKPRTWQTRTEYRPRPWILSPRWNFTIQHTTISRGGGYILNSSRNLLKRFSIPQLTKGV